ncbi:MAG: hypothetical protein ABFD59_06810 [Smithella sp.]|jgi:hypothetical protein
MYDEEREFIKSKFPEMTTEETNKIAPGILRWTAKFKEGMYYRMVAECIQSKFCTLGIKPGDKYVIYGALVNRDESTAPHCLLALSPLVEHYYSFIDRMLLGQEDPNEERLYETSVCLDRGIDNGGLGKVQFKITYEKIAKEEWMAKRA